MAAFVPAVELPKIKVVWAKVIIDDIIDNRDSLLVCGLYQVT
jgi:hypothetical protein